MKSNDKTMISVPVEDIDRYLNNMSDLLEVHFNLIELFQQEDKLKKHHRPYLHVREQIAATIEETTPIVVDIAAQIIADGKAIKAEDILDEMAIDIGAEAGHCSGCPCKGCEIGCWNCGHSPSCFDEVFDYPTEDEEDAEIGTDGGDDVDAMNHLTSTPTGDFEEYVNAPDGSIVLMKKKDCDALLNVILMLAEQVRMVTEMRCEDYSFIDEYAKFFPAFAAFEHDRLDVYKDARFEADAITDFIGEADFRCYPLTTVELPD